MAIEWRAAHFSHGADGHADGRIVAGVVRYADIDYEHGHQVRGHYFQGFLTGHERPQVPGRWATLEEAEAAVESFTTGPLTPE